MKVIFTITLAAMFFCSSIASAQNVVPRDRVEAMFKSFTPAEVERAIETFGKDSLIKPELVDSLQSQVKTMITLENPVIGFEFIQEQNIGQSVKRLTYVLKTANEPFIWNFSFYKPTVTWLPLGASVVREF